MRFESLSRIKESQLILDMDNAELRKTGIITRQSITLLPLDMIFITKKLF